MPTFGEVLKAAREGAKLTQQQLAAKAGLSQAAISKAELAPTPDDAGRKETIEKIAAAAGTTIETLVREMSPPHRARRLDVGDLFPAPVVSADADSEHAEGAPSALTKTLDERIEEERRNRADRGWWETDKYDSNKVLAYLGDVIGRNFDHKQHKIVDSHELLVLFESFLDGSNSYLALRSHWSQDIDLGVRAMLDAVSMLRVCGSPIHMPNLVLAMAVSSGAMLRRAVQRPTEFVFPPIVKDIEDIPF